MEKLVIKILKILKEHVRQNIKEIQYNQDEINRMLTDSSSSVNSKELDYKYALNKELLEENEEFIQMQVELNEFMDKYSHLFTSRDEYEFEEKESNKEDKSNFFSKTVNGELKFGPKHPQFNNPKFFQDLLKYYQEKEDYEKCQELLKLKDFMR
jgi:hypothetical protein